MKKYVKKKICRIKDTGNINTNIEHVPIIMGNENQNVDLSLNNIYQNNLQRKVIYKFLNKETLHFII